MRNDRKIIEDVKTSEGKMNKQKTNEEEKDDVENRKWDSKLSLAMEDVDIRGDQGKDKTSFLYLIRCMIQEQVKEMMKQN